MQRDPSQPPEQENPLPAWTVRAQQLPLLANFAEPNGPVFAALVLALVSSAAFRFLYALDTPSIWFDEATTWHNISHSWHHLYLQTTWGEDSGGFIYAATMKLWTGVFGFSEFSLRIPSVLATLATLGVLLRTGMLVWGRKAGLYAALIFSLYGDTLLYARQVRAYSFLLLFGSLCLLALVFYWQGPRKKASALLLVSSLLTVLTQGFGLFLAAGVGLAQGLLWWRVPDAEKRMAGLLAATWPPAVACAVALVWTQLMKSRIVDVFDHWWIHGSIWSSYSAILDEWLWIAAGCGLLFVGSVRAMHRAALMAIVAVASTVSVGPGIVSLMSSGDEHFILQRYLINLLPCAALAGGYALSRLPSLPSAVVALLLLANATGRLPANTYAENAPFGQNVRQVARHLADSMNEGDRVIVLPERLSVTFAYYGVDVPPWGAGNKDVLAAWTAGELERRLWVIGTPRKIARHSSAVAESCPAFELGDVTIHACPERPRDAVPH